MAAVLVLWSTQAAAITRSGFDLVGDRPLSELVNRSGGEWLFPIGLVSGAVLFLLFLAYLRQVYPVGAAFTIAMAVGMVGQLVAGVLPIGGDGWVSRTHVFSALVLGASIPVLMWRFAADQPPGAWRVRCYRLFWLEAAACVAGVVLSRRHVAPLAEILPALAFHLWVFVVTVAAPTAAVGATAAAQPSTVSSVARMSSP